MFCGFFPLRSMRPAWLWRSTSAWRPSTVCHVRANHIGCAKEDFYWSFIDGIREDNVLRSLRHALSIKHDAIVMKGDQWQTLPRDVREALLEQVELGTGLVFLDSEAGSSRDTAARAALAASGAPAASGCQRSSPRACHCATCRSCRIPIAGLDLTPGPGPGGSHPSRRRPAVDARGTGRSRAKQTRSW